VSSVLLDSGASGAYDVCSCHCPENTVIEFPYTAMCCLLIRSAIAVPSLLCTLLVEVREDLKGLAVRLAFSIALVWWSPWWSTAILLNSVSVLATWCLTPPVLFWDRAFLMEATLSSTSIFSFFCAFDAVRNADRLSPIFHLFLFPFFLCMHPALFLVYRTFFLLLGSFFFLFEFSV